MYISIEDIQKRRDEVADHFAPLHRSVLDAFVYSLESIPPAEVSEVKHGEWIRYPHGSGIYCSLCRHKRRYRDIRDKFCPNCGANMEEE